MASKHMCPVGVGPFVSVSVRSTHTHTHTHRQTHTHAHAHSSSGKWDMSLCWQWQTNCTARENQLEDKVTNRSDSWDSPSLSRSLPWLSQYLEGKFSQITETHIFSLISLGLLLSGFILRNIFSTADMLIYRGRRSRCYCQGLLECPSKLLLLQTCLSYPQTLFSQHGHDPSLELVTFTHKALSVFGKTKILN